MTELREAALAIVRLAERYHDELGDDLDVGWLQQESVAILRALVERAVDKEQDECVQDAAAEAMVCGCATRIMDRIRARSK